MAPKPKPAAFVPLALPAPPAPPTVADDAFCAVNPVFTGRVLSLSIFRAILAGLVPPAGTALALLPRNGLLARLARVLLTVVAGRVEPGGAILAALCDNGLILPGRGRIRLTVIPGAVSTGRAFVADTGDGVLCYGGGGYKQGCTADDS